MSTVHGPSVYLTFSPHDSAAAKLLKKDLASQGVVVEFLNQSTKQELPNRTRELIAQSEAVIVLATSASLQTTDLAFEVGAAQAWDKPIYVVAKGITISALPDYLKEFRVYPVKDVKKLAARIHQEMLDLSEEEREWLIDWYQNQKVSIVDLIDSDTDEKALANEFQRKWRRNASGDRLMGELLRLHLQRQLPDM